MCLQHNIAYDTISFQLRSTRSRETPAPLSSWSSSILDAALRASNINMAYYLFHFSVSVRHCNPHPLGLASRRIKSTERWNDVYYIVMFLTTCFKYNFIAEQDPFTYKCSDVVALRVYVLPTHWNYKTVSFLLKFYANSKVITTFNVLFPRTSMHFYGWILKERCEYYKWNTICQFVLSH